MIKIVEVGPRDGLQNEPKTIPTETKIQFIEKLVAAGHQTIEITSFVSPKWVPQMADHHIIAEHFASKNSDCHFMALTPNLTGLENAHQAGIKQIAVFTAASETFTQKNINCSILQSLDNFQQIIEQAKKYNIRVRGYISCTLGCPYEGETPEQTVLDIATKLYEAGCYEISIGDTIGVGTPIAEGKDVRQFNGENYILEESLTADFAVIKAWKADTMGNLVFNKTAMNFNPMMATAAKITVVEVEEIVEPGELDPNHIHIPGIYVKRVIKGQFEKRIERKTLQSS